ncbi:MAG: hypothetical protein IT285_08480 [Bdellovibrionales bacterium]|nr:hypothetical protein [Bdellovibrionales bacterium]
MSPSSEKTRFRLNPVELMIFGAMAVVLANSVYHLFYDWGGVRPVAVGQLPERDPNDPAGDRRVASLPSAPSVVSLNVSCGSQAQIPTSAERVRLSGGLCGLPTGSGSEGLIKTEIVNQTNRTAATVFTDVTAGKFSTDFIPLNPGLNRLELKFVHQGGKTVVERVQIMRTE